MAHIIKLPYDGEIRLCVACRYHFVGRTNLGETIDMCTAFDTSEAGYINLVTGERIQDSTQHIAISCETMRSHETGCGIEGKNYVGK